MDSTTPLVVKVSYGGVLRRFRVSFNANGQLDLDMAALKGKISSLFKFSSDDFSLTYSDEDGDVVALIDDSDLFDVTNQRLKFLKINVQSNTSVTGIKNDDVLTAVPNHHHPMRETANLNQPTTGSAASKASSGHVPTSSGGGGGLGASFNECPFSGSTVNNSCPNPVVFKKHPRRVCHSGKSSNGGDYWTSLGVFHKGIRCDGCGVLPITGPRFKSKVKEDYDLCTICFSVMGNEGDYTWMDKPASVQHSLPFRGQLTPVSNPWVGHVPQPQHGGLHFRCTRPKLDCRFVLDVNVFDGTVFAPSAQFTKIWKMRNNGSLVWPHGTRIVWIGGDRLSNSLSVDLQIPAEGAPIESELDVKVDFVAPELPGRYISYWRMASSSGAKFGQRVWVLIHVNAYLKDSVVNEFHGLNLNVSPDEEFTGINVNHEPAQAGSSSVNPGEEKGADLEGEAAGSKVPEKDDLPVGEVEVASLTPSSSSSSFNMIEFPNIPAVEALGGGSSSTKDIPVDDLQDDTEKNDVEITMLKELEEMGFREFDLNKEILRDNEYNLEQSVEALCGVSEWDPILEELQEMGFCDDATNKKLLKKNNGSIKGVVMDLLTGEKEA